MRILGLDYGEARVGVAVSDESGKIAFDCGIIDATKGRNFVSLQVLELADKYNTDTVVIGYPVNMDGSHGFRVKATEKFAKYLAQMRPTLRIEFFDERLTTKSADAALLEMGVSQRHKGMNDIIAAMLILQAYLDSKDIGG
ncbi:MAG: Holliday junction resolvase RuvX [Clostridia bacterium]|nr:Holliday junction resolvase RuvX [Clostridia bacterium]MBR3838805.1 Holliday junction resolvase RuvX [Clostridia bacterium]